MSPLKFWMVDKWNVEKVIIDSVKESVFLCMECQYDGNIINVDV